MGLAASQARLLSITSRISDNELRAQLINNQKMRLSSESSKVSENYINALNKTNLVFANYDENDKAQNVPLTFNNLTAFNQYNNQYCLTNTAGNILISEREAELYQAADGNQEEYLKQHGIEYTTSYWDTISEQLEDAGLGDFTAEQLKKMYEGDTESETKIPSYDETIKTQAYTDFAGYADEFAEIKGLLNRAENQKGILLGSFAEKAMQMSDVTIPNVSLNGTTVSNISAFQTVLSTLLNNNFKQTNEGDFANFTAIINQTKVNEWFNNYSITQDGDKYTSPLSNEELGITGTPTTSVATSGPATNNLYYRDATGATYMRQYCTYDNEDNTISTWIKLPGIANNVTAGSCSTTIYKLNGNQMEDTGTRVSSAQLSINNGKYELKISKDDEEGSTSTETLKYGAPGQAATTSVVYSKSEIENQLKEYLTDLIKQQFIECGKKYDVNENSTALKEMSQEEQEKLTKSTTANSLDMTTVIDGLKNCMFNTPVTYSADQLLVILNYLTSGVKWQTQGSKELNDGKENFTFEWNKLKTEMEPIINAYVIDTMMDIFGEPVYGYLYTDRNGKVQAKNGNIDANAEAKWYINLFNKIQKSGHQMLPNGLASSTDWMQFALENGIVIMEQINSEGAWQPITYTSCSDIIEQNDKTAATIAEAEYNKAMRQIESKDEMFDLELKNIDTEHAALESEYESVKKAMSGNIERTFQMYG